MVLLYRDFYEKHYKVPCCSCVAFIWCIFFALVLIVPWILAWSVGGKSLPSRYAPESNLSRAQGSGSRNGRTLNIQK